MVLSTLIGSFECFNQPIRVLRTSLALFDASKIIHLKDWTQDFRVRIRHEDHKKLTSFFVLSFANTISSIYLLTFSKLMLDI